MSIKAVPTVTQWQGLFLHALHRPGFSPEWRELAQEWLREPQETTLKRGETPKDKSPLERFAQRVRSHSLASASERTAAEQAALNMIEYDMIEPDMPVKSQAEAWLILLNYFFEPLFPLGKQAALELKERMLNRDLPALIWGRYMHFAAQCGVVRWTELVIARKFPEWVEADPIMAADTCRLIGAGDLAFEIIGAAIRGGKLSENEINRCRQMWKGEKGTGSTKSGKALLSLLKQDKVPPKTGFRRLRLSFSA